MGEERWEVSVWESHRQGNRRSCTGEYIFFFVTLCFSTERRVFLTPLPRRLTQKVSDGCAACNQSRRCYFKIVEAQASNYHAEKAAVASNRCRRLAALVISFLSLFTTASPTQHPVAGLHFTSQTAAEKPPVIDAAKKERRKSRRIISRKLHI